MNAGAGRAANHRNMDATFGGITLGPDAFPTVYLSKSETDLRRSLASVAYAYGWDVREEVVIPGWGRIDIVLGDTDGTYLVELKIELTKPARIRKAFQQADGYGRWWAANVGRPADTILVGLEVDAAALATVADAYLLNVSSKSVGDFLYFLEHGKYGSGCSARARMAKTRAGRAAQISEFHSAAASRLEGAILRSQAVSA
jgi:hypothetical protein